MERDFLSQKGSGDGRGVKEKNQVSANDAAKVVSVSSAVEEPMLSSLGGSTVEKVTENHDAVATNSPISYAKLVTDEPSRKSVNFRTRITLVRNGADVAVPLESIRAVSKQFANSAYGFFLGKRVRRQRLSPTFKEPPPGVREITGIEVVDTGRAMCGGVRARVEISVDTILGTARHVCGLEREIEIFPHHLQEATLLVLQYSCQLRYSFDQNLSLHLLLLPSKRACWNSNKCSFKGVLKKGITSVSWKNSGESLTGGLGGYTVNAEIGFGESKVSAFAGGGYRRVKYDGSSGQISVGARLLESTESARACKLGRGGGAMPYGWDTLRGAVQLLHQSRLRLITAISRGSFESDTEDVDIETLTLEQYLALKLNNTRKSFARPENSTFEVKGQLLRELRKISFSGGPTDNAVEHISNILEVASIFKAQESTLVQVFPLTLEGIAKRFFERTST
ncbi:hypothetical protein Tco_1420871 [Tanacetum coccineum]